MKIKHSVIAAILALLLIAVVAVTGIADSTVEYTGNVAEATSILARFESANNLSNRRKALDMARDYVETVNPEEEGYDTLLETLDRYSLAVANEYLSEANEANSTSYKLDMLNLLADSLKAHPVSETNEGYAAFVAAYESEKIATAEAFLAEATAAEDATAKHAALDGVKAIIDNHAPTTLSADFTARCEAESFATAKLLLANIDVANGNAKNGVAVRLLLNFVGDHYFSEEYEDYAEYAQEFAAELAAHNAAIAAAKEQLNKLNAPDNFTEDKVYNIDFDEVGFGLEGDNNQVNGEIVSEIGIEEGMDGDNKYYTVNFDYANRHLRTTAKLTKITFPYVYEMDLTTFDKLPSASINFEDYISENGYTWNPVHLTINAKGNLLKSDKVLLENAIVPGQWTHLSVAINVDTANIDIYVDYELVYSYSLEDTKNGYSSFTPSMVRIGGTATTAGGSLTIDNFKLYSGVAPIDFDTVDAWTDEARFTYYAERLIDENTIASAKKAYYTELTNTLHLFWDGSAYLTDDAATRAAVDSYLAMDISGVNKQIEIDNLAALEAVYRKLVACEPGEANYTKRNYYLNEIDSITSKTVGAILVNDLYHEITEYTGRIREDLAMERLAVEFTGYVNNFYAAPSVDKKQENFALANELLPALNMALLNDAINYPTFVDALIRSKEMERILIENVCIENSKLLLACISYVLKYETEAEWDANYTNLAPYVATAREVIEEGNYDVYYNNLGEAIARFEPMNEYFYNRMLEDRNNYVENEVARMLASEVYFEKYGIAMKLKDYFVENNIDTTTGVFAEYLDTINNVLNELMENEEAYEEMLTENTKKFIKVCEGLVGSIDYNKMKEICAEAAVYYYNMNVSNALAQDAIKIYTTRRNEVRMAEELADEFIKASLKLTVFEGDNILPLFVELSDYLDDLDFTVPGVSEAAELLENEMAEYNAKINPTNAEINATVSTVVYVSNTPGVSSLVTKILEAIFN